MSKSVSASHRTSRAPAGSSRPSSSPASRTIASRRSFPTSRRLVTSRTKRTRRPGRRDRWRWRRWRRRRRGGPPGRPRTVGGSGRRAFPRRRSHHGRPGRRCGRSDRRRHHRRADRNGNSRTRGQALRGQDQGWQHPDRRPREGLGRGQQGQGDLRETTTRRTSRWPRRRASRAIRRRRGAAHRQAGRRCSGSHARCSRSHARRSASHERRSGSHGLTTLGRLHGRPDRQASSVARGFQTPAPLRHPSAEPEVRCPRETERTAQRNPRKVPLDNAFRVWAWVDSNHRPHAYQACALTT
jgi:hypothetical protein